MDWSKAKNILIMAFIVTNIFLAYALFSIDQDNQALKVDDEFISEVKGILKSENIKIDSNIPNEIPSLPTVSLEYENYEVTDMADKLLGDYSEEYIVGIKKYISDTKMLEFFNNNKKIIYRDIELRDSLNKTKISKDQALELSKSFLTSIGFDLSDAKISFYSEDDLVHKFEYSKAIDGVPIEETNMKIEVSSEGVIVFERYWMKNAKKEDRVLSASSAPKALLRLLTRERYYGKTIVDIQICYYFDTDRYIENVGFKESTGGVAIPTWRFVFSDGEKAFLEEN